MTSMHKVYNSDNKALKTFLVVTLTFGICYTPLFLLGVLETYVDFLIPDWIFLLTSWMPFCNCVCNVYIYCFFNKSYRQTAKKVLFRMFPRCKTSVVPQNINL